jgi:succinate dehydrogenase / fumarate reductase cytochrome b subunit
MTTQTSRWQRALRGWFDPRGRDAGLIAFALNRISGLALVLYLVLHLCVLSTLTHGEPAWEGFLRLAHTPLFFLLDMALFAAILYHGLNGVRVSLIGLGYGGRQQKSLFYGLAAAAVVIWGIAVWLMATV